MTFGEEEVVGSVLFDWLLPVSHNHITQSTFSTYRSTVHIMLHGRVQTRGAQ